MTLKYPKLYHLTEDNELRNLIVEPTCFKSKIRTCIDSLLTLTFEIKNSKMDQAKLFIGCLPRILLGPLWNTFSLLKLVCRQLLLPVLDFESSHLAFKFTLNQL